VAIGNSYLSCCNGEEMMEESGVINAAFAYTVEGIFGTLDHIVFVPHIH
jgi:hypothetical protein